MEELPQVILSYILESFIGRYKQLAVLCCVNSHWRRTISQLAPKDLTCIIDMPVQWRATFPIASCMAIASTASFLSVAVMLRDCAVYEAVKVLRVVNLDGMVATSIGVCDYALLENNWGPRFFPRLRTLIVKDCNAAIIELRGIPRTVTTIDMGGWDAASIKMITAEVDMRDVHIHQCTDTVQSCANVTPMLMRPNWSGEGMPVSPMLKDLGMQALDPSRAGRRTAMCLCGARMSGKTTFANRLVNELRANWIARGIPYAMYFDPSYAHNSIPAHFPEFRYCTFDPESEQDDADLGKYDSNCMRLVCMSAYRYNNEHISDAFARDPRFRRNTIWILEVQEPGALQSHVRSSFDHLVLFGKSSSTLSHNYITHLIMNQFAMKNITLLTLKSMLNRCLTQDGLAILYDVRQGDSICPLRFISFL